MERFFLKSLECDLQKSNLTKGDVCGLLALFEEGIEVLKGRHGDLDRFNNEELYTMLTSWLEEELTLL